KVGVVGPERVGIGGHPGGDVRADRLFEGSQVDLAVGARLDLAYLVAGHGGGRRVGAVGAVRHEYDPAAVAFAARLVVGANHEYAGQLRVRSCGWLQAEGVHAGDGGQVALQLVEELKGALGRRRVLVRMHVLEQAGRFLVDLGVVLHRAGAQGVEV